VFVLYDVIVVETRSFWVCSGSCWCHGHASIPQVYYRLVYQPEFDCLSSVAAIRDLGLCKWDLICFIVSCDIKLFNHTGHAWTSDFGCSDKEEDFRWLIT